MKTLIATLSCLVLLGGCVSPGVPVVTDSDHPANPNASEAAATSFPDTLNSKESAPSSPIPEPKPHQHTAKPEAATEEIYTCPMHPEVIRSSPGSCPKCGMKLVKKVRTLKEGDKK